MPKAFPAEFRGDVVAVARKGEGPISRIAKDFGLSESCLPRWLKLADIEDGVKPLRNAVALRNPAGTTIHSDRGSQFLSRKFVELLRETGITGSMGRVGACGDNAAMESIFSLLQKDVLDKRRWATAGTAGGDRPRSSGPTTAADGAEDSAGSPRSSLR